MEYEYINIISKIIMIIVPIIMVISIVFSILLMTSSKIRGKMLAKNIKAAKYMMDETKEDLISIDEKLITPIGQDTEGENTSDFDFEDGDDDDLGDLDEDEFPEDEIDADFDDMMEGDE